MTRRLLQRLFHFGAAGRKISIPTFYGAERIGGQLCPGEGSELTSGFASCCPKVVSRCVPFAIDGACRRRPAAARCVRFASCVPNTNRTQVRRAEASRSGGPQFWQTCVLRRLQPEQIVQVTCAVLCFGPDRLDVADVGSPQLPLGGPWLASVPLASTRAKCVSPQAERFDPVRDRQPAAVPWRPMAHVRSAGFDPSKVRVTAGRTARSRKGSAARSRPLAEGCNSPKARCCLRSAAGLQGWSDGTAIGEPFIAASGRADATSQTSAGRSFASL